MKKIVYIFLCINFLLSSLCINAGIIDVIQWTIACGWPTFRGLVGAEQILDYHLKKLDISREKEAPENVQDYVHESLTPVLKNAQELKVFIWPDKGIRDYAADLNSIYIGINPTTKKTMLEELLEKRESNELTDEDHKNFSMINWVLHHEANHIINKDKYTKTMANFIIPTITWLGFKKLKNRMNHIPYFNPLTAIPFAIGLAILNRELLNAYSRYIEYQADRVPNDKELLNGGIRFMDLEIQKEPKLIKFFENEIKTTIPENRQKIAAFAIKFVKWFSYDHPTNENRKTQLEKQLKKLD
ncbi:MAG: M48 family metalloprotease [Candidatus Babeliales bacterium]